MRGSLGRGVCQELPEALSLQPRRRQRRKCITSNEMRALQLDAGRHPGQKASWHSGSLHVDSGLACLVLYLDICILRVGACLALGKGVGGAVTS